MEPDSTHTHPKDDEAAVRAVIDAIARSVRRKDVDALMAQCAPEIRTFDMVPPLQHVGEDAIRAVWKRVFDAFEGPLEFEVHRLDVAVGGDIAFCRSLNRLSGTRKDGSRADSWHCMTLGFGKNGGLWKVLHQHVSVPFDMETGKALLDLEPPPHRGG